MLLFAMQVAFYTPDFSKLLKYAFGQTGMNNMEASRWRMLMGVFLKGSVLVGPSPMLGLVGGVAVWLRQRTSPLLVRASGLYSALFLLAAIALTRFAFRERSLYSYLVFPASCLTAWALEQIRATLGDGLFCSRLASASHTSRQRHPYRPGLEHPKSWGG